MDPEIFRLRIVTTCSTVFIITVFAASYLLWGHDGLPIGWDTPYYIQQSKIAVAQGPLTLIYAQGFYNFVYQLLLGLIEELGSPALSSEIFLPIALVGLFPYLISRLVWASSNVRLATFASMTTPAWYALYDIGATEHANLLALALILAALGMLFQSKRINQRESIAGLILFGIASFTHVETTLFFVGVILLLSLAFPILPFRMVILLVAVVSPATAAYVTHLSQILRVTGYNLPSYTPEPFWFWLEIFGLLLPIVAYGLLSLVSRGRSSIEYFALIWASTSILLGVSHYFVPQTYAFAQRAATIVPVPLLAAFGLAKLGQKIRLARPGGFSFSYYRNGLLVAAVLLLLVSWPTTYWTSAYVHQRVFITSSAYQRLQWVSSNLKFENTPIFMYNDVDVDAGGLGDLWSNWVGAIIGTHLSYLGQIDYLVQIQQTPYDNVVSRIHSVFFAKQLNDAGITNRTTLLQHPIIIIKDFYKPFPLPAYTAVYFDQVSDGILVSNNQRLESLDSVTIPLSWSLTSSVGPWHIIQHPWAESIYTLDASNNSTLTKIEVTFPLGVSSNGTYSISLRYFDGTGNNLELALDGTRVGTVQYGGTYAPSTLTLTSVPLDSGVHYASIGIAQNPSSFQYASLDYLSVVKA